MVVQSQMSKNTNKLRRSLLVSHLSIAMLGILLLLGSLMNNLWLRDSAINLATITEPKSEAVEHLQAGMQQALANLRGWIALGEDQFKKNRYLTWHEKIYPALKRMEQLAAIDSHTKNVKFTSLTAAFRDLEMWQWRIEDVAQSAGNFPAKDILENLSQPQMLFGIGAAAALIEMTLKDNIQQGLTVLIKLRKNWYLADIQLNRYVLSGVDSGYSEYQRLINLTVAALQEYQHSAYLKPIRSNQTYLNQEWHDQIILMSDSLKTYQVLAIESIDIRQSGQSNVANNLLKQQAIPLVASISKLLQVISTTEKQTMMQDVQKIKWIGSLVPWVMLILMILMFLLALFLAYNGIRKFIVPVLELEWRNRLKADLAQLNDQMHGDLDIHSLLEQVIEHLCPTVNAAAGAIYIVKDKLLYPEACYGLTLDQLPQHIGFGEQLTGQVWKNARIIEISAPATEHLIQSSLLHITPRSVLGLPVVFEGQVTAVIELLSLQTFNTKQREYLEKAAVQIGLALQYVSQSVRIKETLLETQNQAEELRSQQEELRLSNEELTSRGNELISQAHALEESRKEAEEKARKLDETSRYKSEFLANMSHELRTPLNSLLILAHYLSENESGNLSDDEVESASVIEDSGKNLLNLINDILDISKIESGHMDVHQDAINLNELAQHVMRNFSHIAEQQGVGFSVEVDNKLPDVIETDSAKLNQILTNLISNALKFTHKGGVILRIGQSPTEDIMQRASDNLSSNLLSFEVEDSGVGIPEDKQTLIFQAFQQADGSTTRNYGGTGLGLSIALNFARLLGGDIRLHSEVGVGSAFTLYIPLLEAQVTSNTETTSASTEATKHVFPVVKEKGTGQVVRILVVEDDPVTLGALGKVLDKLPVKTTSAQTAQQALDAISNNKFDIMLLDLGLPNMNGEKLLKTIEVDKDIEIPYVIVHTGKDLSIDEQASLNRYTNKVIIKSANSAERLSDEISLFIRRMNRPLEKTIKEPDTSVDMHGIRVLLVDDDMRNIYALSKILTKQGMEVQMAPSGEKALEILDQAGSFDLILMDIMMPGMDGYQTTREIRLRPGVKDIPVIALTAKAMPGDKEKCLQAGANDYLSKPVDTVKLMTLIQLWVSP